MKTLNKKIVFALTGIFLVAFVLFLVVYVFSFDDKMNLKREENISAEKESPENEDNIESEKTSTSSKKNNNPGKQEEEENEYKEVDDDTDLMYDDVEQTYEQRLIPGKDNDNDGLLNYQEVEIFDTDPRKKDSDNDGLDDMMEIKKGTDPNNPDTDGDGYKDGQEVEAGHDPMNAN